MSKGTIMSNCPFCGRQAIVMNPQSVPVCSYHKDAYLELKCVCGKWLDIMDGKYGPYGNCLKCGNLSLSKALSINKVMTAPDVPKAPTHTIIRSDEL